MLFWRRKEKSYLIICSAWIKCIIHRLLSSHAGGKINWAKKTQRFDDAFLAMTSFCAKKTETNKIAGPGEISKSCKMP